DLQRVLQFSVAQNFDSSNIATHELQFAQQLFVHHCAGFKFIQIAQVDDCVGRMKGSVGETALWTPTNQSHLSAFESATTAPTRARLLTFVAFAAGFSVTGAF